MLTVPMIGWSPNTRTKTYSYSVAKYGAQTSNECVGANYASWCISDAGNGILSSSSAKITWNNKSDTSKAVGTSFATDMLNHLHTVFGTASNGGVKYFSLDNEVTLWDSTHMDVHSDAVSYDEIWSKTLAYTTALKGVDANIKLFGPVPWGWCAYFWSGVDNCGQSPTDREAHDDTPFLVKETL